MTHQMTQFGMLVAPAFQRVMDNILVRPPTWKQGSEEYYWQALADHRPFRSIYLCENGLQPLLDQRNISQTPREQCEIDGFIKVGLDHPGPGQEITLCNLKRQPQLNGIKGRVLPMRGPAAPSTPAAPGRIPVRLTTNRELSCWPGNLTSPHGPALDNRPTGRLADLIRRDLKQGQIPMPLSRSSLLKSGLKAEQAVCVSCSAAGGDEEERRLVALARTAQLSSTPMRNSVQLMCIDCLVRVAQFMEVPEDAEDVEEFVESQCMGAMEASWMLMGLEREACGSRRPDGSFSSTKLY